MKTWSGRPAGVQTEHLRWFKRLWSWGGFISETADLLWFTPTQRVCISQCTNYNLKWVGGSEESSLDALSKYRLVTICTFSIFCLNKKWKSRLMVEPSTVSENVKCEKQPRGSKITALSLTYLSPTDSLLSFPFLTWCQNSVWLTSMTDDDNLLLVSVLVHADVTSGTVPLAAYLWGTPLLPWLLPF